MIPLSLGLVSLLAFCTFSLVEGVAEEKMKIYIRGVACNVSAKFVNQDYKCFAKSYNRSYSTWTFVATSKMPLYNLNVRSLTLNVRKSVKYPLTGHRAAFLPLRKHLPRSYAYALRRRLLRPNETHENR